ncbi:MAG: DUF1345 domain-containing protein [Scytonematopsis contorta HA4267-MV1]|jgi:uncharacterized membrane protein|nr:DUF1345 domain-containing protein [Scytonematopsis contorta HA4267-MV1]
MTIIEESKPRLLLSSVFAGVIFLLLPSVSLEFRLLAAWDGGVLCFLALVGLMMINANAEKTRDSIQNKDVDHLAIFLLVVFISFSSLFVISGVLAKHKDTFSPEVALCIVAVLCSWLLMHTVFALHYATCYYRKPDFESEAEYTEYIGGLSFSSGEAPDYLDFMYFTFTLGMTSQTSDTALVTSAMRRLALGHTIISFFFYSVIMALTVSIISGLI